MTIVFIADIPKNYRLKQRPQYLADELAKNHKVHYICPTIRLHPHSRYGIVRKLSLWLGNVPFVSAVLAYLQYTMEWKHRRPDLVFIQSIQFVTLARLLKPERIWFDYIDNAFGFGDLPLYCQKDFEWLQLNANYVSATCRALAESMKHRADVLTIPNGVNLYAYSGLHRTFNMS